MRRRATVLLFVTAVSILAPGLSGAEVDEEFVERLARHAGRWSGTYTYWNAAGEIVDQHASVQIAALDGDRWSQRIEYRWPDGRERVQEFVAHIDGRTLVWEDDQFDGELTVVNDRVLIFEARWRSMPDLYVVETITTQSADRQVRTWQVFRGELLDQVVRIEESREPSEE